MNQSHDAEKRRGWVATTDPLVARGYSSLPPILHGRYSLGKVQNRYIWLFLFGLIAPSPTEGFPWDDLHKNFTSKSIDVQRTKWRKNIAENCTNVTDRRTHDDIERTFTVAKKYGYFKINIVCALSLCNCQCVEEASSGKWQYSSTVCHLCK